MSEITKRDSFIAIFSDLHVHSYKQHNKGGTRLNDCLSAFIDILAYCKANGISKIFFGGDIFDQQKVLPISVFNEFTASVKAIISEYPEIMIYGISGNHDYETKNLITKPAVSALEGVRNILPNFILLDSSWSQGVYVISETMAVVGIPYFEYPEHFNEALDIVYKNIKNFKETRGDMKVFLMIHQTPMYQGMGMIPYDTDPRDSRYSVFDYVFCGHIHTRMQLADNFIVVGNPLHRDASDAGKRKGFLVMNGEKPEKGVHFVHLAGYPEFKEVEGEGEPYYEETEEGKFIIVPKPSGQVIKVGDEAKAGDIARFSSSLTKQALIENYWKVVDGKDKGILEAGLALVK